MIKAISVSKFNNYIKQIFDSEELLHNIAIEGEVFGVSITRNVIYFNLKDEDASLPCVCFYPNYVDKIVEGNKIIVTGTPNFYSKAGRLNFNVVQVENFGQGNLYEEFLKMKQKLSDEGLFDEGHKKPIPKEIKRIGVITSKEGAVIEDIKNVAWRRNPAVDIVLYNTKVQGNNAENEIAKAIKKLGDYDKIDVIIVARGGGSLEDLAAYNTEIVARATYNCSKPIISAVGHETDFTIIDFVSDLRAPTPSAAAELITFNLSDKKLEIKEIVNKFKRVMGSYLDDKYISIKSQLNQISYSYEKRIMRLSFKFNNDKNALLNNIQSYLNEKLYEIGIFENTLNKINPHEIINRGYAKIEQRYKNIHSIEEVDLAQNINIILKDGVITASPTKKETTNEIK